MTMLLHATPPGQRPPENERRLELDDGKEAELAPAPSSPSKAPLCPGVGRQVLVSVAGGRVDGRAAGALCRTWVAGRGQHREVVAKMSTPARALRRARCGGRVQRGCFRPL